MTIMLNDTDRRFVNAGSEPSTCDQLRPTSTGSGMTARGASDWPPTLLGLALEGSVALGNRDRVKALSFLQ